MKCGEYDFCYIIYSIEELKNKMSTNYEKFIVANQALIDCYKAVPAESFSAMSLADQGEVCKAESLAVKDHFK